MLPQSTTPYLSEMKIQGLKSKWLRDLRRALYLACSFTCHLGVSHDSARIIYIRSWVEKRLLESKDPIHQKDTGKRPGAHTGGGSVPLVGIMACLAAFLHCSL